MVNGLRAMLTISNSSLSISCDPAGADLSIEDKVRGARWSLDYRSLVFSRSAFRKRVTPPQIDGPLVPIAAQCIDDTIQVTFEAGNERISHIYRLDGDSAVVTLAADSAAGVRGISLPGQFIPADGPVDYLLPIMQGMLWRRGGASFQWQVGEASHTGYSMAFIGYLAATAGLMVCLETRDDAILNVSKSPDGTCSAQFVQVSSLGTMRYDRIVRITPVEGNIVAVAKAYRRHIKSRGQFRSWEEKVAERPALERLFGSLMCFIGYCHDDLDYAAELAKLKAYGFDRALVYPARFDNYHQSIVMGGQPPIDLSPDNVAAIRRLGYDVAPWSWVDEALDDGQPETQHMFRRDKDGEPMLFWRIEDQRWNMVCSTFMAPYKAGENLGRMSDMTWDHFDVVTCAANDECYALDHPGHLGRPLSRSEDRAQLKELLRVGASGSRAVSSESFNDAFSVDYDLGSVKAFPMFRNWPFWPIPLTMLVYHDSMIHSAWEVHNYNYGGFNRDGGNGMFEYGGGRPALQAAQDALMGCPPDVFPIGAQYQWTGNGAETTLTKFRFEDPEVQIALKQALPVAKLHSRIGKLEMIDFQILSDDGNLQRSSFADGTTIVANFGTDLRRGVDGVGNIHGESWVQIA